MMLKRAAESALKSLDNLDTSKVKAVKIVFGEEMPMKKMSGKEEEMEEDEMEDEEEMDSDEEESSGEMCSKCGHKCPMGSKYCPNCGDKKEY